MLDLLNLGPQSTTWLAEAGITTTEDLQRVGAVMAYHLVKQRQPRASLNLLWALAAGLEGRDWRTLTENEKQRLKAALAELTD